MEKQANRTRCVRFQNAQMDNQFQRQIDHPDVQNLSNALHQTNL